MPRELQQYRNMLLRDRRIVVAVFVELRHEFNMVCCVFFVMVRHGFHCQRLQCRVCQCRTSSLTVFFVVIDLIAMVSTSVQAELVRDVEQDFLLDLTM